jgi:hypothetical protein
MELDFQVTECLEGCVAAHLEAFLAVFLVAQFLDASADGGSYAHTCLNAATHGEAGKDGDAHGNGGDAYFLVPAPAYPAAWAGRRFARAVLAVVFVQAVLAAFAARGEVVQLVFDHAADALTEPDLCIAAVVAHVEAHEPAFERFHHFFPTTHLQALGAQFDLVGRSGEDQHAEPRKFQPLGRQARKQGLELVLVHILLGADDLAAVGKGGCQLLGGELHTLGTFRNLAFEHPEQQLNVLAHADAEAHFIHGGKHAFFLAVPELRLWHVEAHACGEAHAHTRVDFHVFQGAIHPIHTAAYARKAQHVLDGFDVGSTIEGGADFRWAAFLVHDDLEGAVQFVAEQVELHALPSEFKAIVGELAIDAVGGEDTVAEVELVHAQVQDLDALPAHVFQLMQLHAFHAKQVQTVCVHRISDRRLRHGPPISRGRRH